MNGSPATSIMALGTFRVCGRSLIARPPGNRAGGGISLGKSYGAVEIESNPDLFESGFAQGVPHPLLVLGIEQKKAAAAGADHLAAQGAVAHGQIIPFVDSGIGHGAGALLLVLPMLVQKRAERVQIAGLQRLERTQAESLDVMKIIDDGSLVRLRPVVLILQDCRSRARHSGE